MTVEQDFETLKAQVRAKIEAAAKLIDEAAELAAKSDYMVEANEHDREWGMDIDENGEVSIGLYHYELNSEVRPLMTALTNAGWSASSMQC
jgi:predicted NAD-dependent protein-ADP-ribosyltransferase YbiA (DUF1768 family)